ncbi:hypothetical protein M409DRAFT_59890 [Zasmidium cellare ATCC 36951]|uniref:DUF1330 domain-containing protein n=1 Tax=Zasmidium cellare ATCC 36951 TaxID=1080233 RepID=A0A6A6C198_ZASCE|nr:uncharacterized protein M409DRAFT_59890 [Zasmidium cellare ATCC 36951]KAF2160643.1 hypothetical protein M409DRAFT_59890 [Zasmidium cellare ATCC 36951]
MTSMSYYLLSLRRTASVAEVQHELKAEGIAPFVNARAVQWVHLPMRADYMLAIDWDVVLGLGSGIQLPERVLQLTDALHKVDVCVASPSPINDKLQSTLPPPQLSFYDRPLRALCTQFHQITPSMLAFADHPLCPKGPISMLNFVSYQPFAFAEGSYQKYLEGVQAGPAKRSGVSVKFNGSLTPLHGARATGEWDLVFLAQYPSFKHFVDMGSDSEYQELNRKYRMPALRDLCILITTEVDLEWTIPGSEKVKPEVSKGVIESANQ